MKKIIIVTDPLYNQQKLCEHIIRNLQGWFELEDAIQNYLNLIPNLPTLIAMYENRPVGFCSLKKHNRYVWEIEIMAVLTNFHGIGIGTKLLKKAESFLVEQQAEYVQVKTLGASHPSQEYARTRKFYHSYGFREMEEFDQIWGRANPCLILIKSVERE